MLNHYVVHLKVMVIVNYTYKKNRTAVKYDLTSIRLKKHEKVLTIYLLLAKMESNG